ncbi:MAG: hypothetical protein RLZZ584_951 [Pseudomonadota bacterium]|jgi:DNA-binding NarL/FixJ family response regulator
MLALLVDDHALMRDGMALLMRHRFAQVRLLQAASLGEACDCLAAEPGIELVLLDLKLGDSQGVDGVTRLRTAAPDATLVVLSGDVRHETVLAAIRAGASGYIPKTARGGAIERALRLVLDGQIYLPPEVLQALQPPAGPATPGLWTSGLAPLDIGFGPIRPRPGLPSAAAAQPAPAGRLAHVNLQAVAAMASQLGLAPRQVDVFKPMLEGAANKVIARELDLAESTVKSHTIAIFRKLGVSSRAEAMVKAAQLGLYAPPDPGQG